jgi:insertion element IS1 protein InsB
MALVHVQCPDCQSLEVMKYGKQTNGTQHYQCNNPDCARHIILLQYHDNGRLPVIKWQIGDMALNGSGVQSCAGPGRQLHHCHRDAQKKASTLQPVNERLLQMTAPEPVEVIIQPVEEAEVDEMWSFVGSKSWPRWLWHAIDHQTGQVLAYIFGAREDHVLN